MHKYVLSTRIYLLIFFPQPDGKVTNGLNEKSTKEDFLRRNDTEKHSSMLHKKI